MSWWRRILGRSEAPPEEPVEEVLAEPAEEVESRPPDDPELRLERLGETPSAVLDDDDVLALIERLRALGRDARAIDLARRVLFHHPERRRIHQRVAEMMASRGDDEGASQLLAPFVDRRGAPLDLLMLAAEIAERRQDATLALALYERVVAEDLDYPRARARVARLREGGRQREADLGATLMADGALARGRYRVERELGRGGAGTVFLAEDLALGRKVALKVYHRRGRAERTRLLVEARVPAAFEHPGVVRIFDLDEALAAIAMERVVGGSVRQELRRGSLSLARIARWFASAAEALAHVHQGRIVHRDFKPSNMLLRADDRVVLTDFGVACDAGHAPEGGVAMAEGTLGYMPPEQRAGAAAATSMDVYALGVSLREVLEHAEEVPPGELRDLAAVCTRAQPADRPTARWLERELRPMAEGRGGSR